MDKKNKSKNVPLKNWKHESGWWLVKEFYIAIQGGLNDVWAGWGKKNGYSLGDEASRITLFAENLKFFTIVS